MSEPVPMIVADDLVQRYSVPGRQPIQALDGVSFTLDRGGILGIMGASGAGKSTLVRLLLGLERPRAGRILIDGQDLHAGTRSQRFGLRRKLQAVFQDPRSSLNPHLPNRWIVEEPLLAAGGLNRNQRRRRIDETLTAVGLAPSVAGRRASELSGGERQRLAIARALVNRPEILVLDEPVSALDGPVRAQILELLADLRRRYDLTAVVVSHDLRSLRKLSDSLLVLHAGVIVERGPTSTILDRPAHPYTDALIRAVPTIETDPGPPGPKLESDPNAEGCPFQGSCPRATARCAEYPDFQWIGDRHQAACWHGSVEPEEPVSRP